jgi:hypothetical protein
MKRSHRIVTRLVVGGLVILAIGLPTIVGVTLGTGPMFRTIPFGLVAGLLGVTAGLVWRIRNPVDNPPVVDAARLLVEEMHNRALLHAFLSELSLPSATVLPGRTISIGPFSPKECSPVLSGWLESRWLDLVTTRLPKSWVDNRPAVDWEQRIDAIEGSEYSKLAMDDARELLRDPDRWSKESRDGYVMVAVSEEGARHPWQEWIAVGEEALAAQVDS